MVEYFFFLGLWERGKWRVLVEIGKWGSVYGEEENGRIFGLGEYLEGFGKLDFFRI